MKAVGNNPGSPIGAGMTERGGEAFSFLNGMVRAVEEAAVNAAAYNDVWLDDHGTRAGCW